MTGRNKPFVAAMKMKVNRKAAANMRIRYLEEELAMLLANWSLSSHEIVFHWIMELLDEILWLKQKSHMPVQQKTSNGITDEQINEAQNADVRTVIQFGRNGKATAWCHDDNTPSLFYGDRIKRAICPVCNKKFNAIDVLMYRDGYSFIDAVKALT